MDTPRNRVAVGLLLLLLGGVVGGLVVRDAFPAPQATPPLPAQPPDFERLSAKWAYPGAKVSGGRNGLIGYYALATTPDDIGKVAAHYQALVGRDIPVNGTSVGGSGGPDDASVSAVESWASGNPRRPRRLVLAARTEAGFSATVVLYQGADDELNPHRGHALGAVSTPNQALQQTGAACRGCVPSNPRRRKQKSDDGGRAV